MKQYPDNNFLEDIYYKIQDQIRYYHDQDTVFRGIVCIAAKYHQLQMSPSKLKRIKYFANSSAVPKVFKKEFKALFGPYWDLVKKACIHCSLEECLEALGEEDNFSWEDCPDYNQIPVLVMNLLDLKEGESFLNLSDINFFPEASKHSRNCYETNIVNLLENDVLNHPAMLPDSDKKYDKIFAFYSKAADAYNMLKPNGTAVLKCCYPDDTIPKECIKTVVLTYHATLSLCFYTYYMIIDKAHKGGIKFIYADDIADVFDTCHIKPWQLDKLNKLIDEAPIIPVSAVEWDDDSNKSPLDPILYRFPEFIRLKDAVTEYTAEAEADEYADLFTDEDTGIYLVKASDAPYASSNGMIRLKEAPEDLNEICNGDIIHDYETDDFVIDFLQEGQTAFTDAKVLETDEKLDPWYLLFRLNNNHRDHEDFIHASYDDNYPIPLIPMEEQKAIGQTYKEICLAEAALRKTYIKE